MQLTRSLVGTCWGVVALTGWMNVAAASICTAELSQRIEAVTTRAEFRQARWGILIQTIEPSPQTLYAHDADRFFIPASNLKLLTTAAVLSQLSPDFRISTTVDQLPSSNQAALLQIVGRADPSFSDAQLQALATQIAARGIQRIQQLVGIDSLQQDSVNSTWEWEDIQAGYGAPVNGLILNQNAIGLSLIPQALGQPLAVQWDDPSFDRSHPWQILNQSVTVAATAPEFVEVGRDLTQPILYVQGQLRTGSAAEPIAISIPNPTQMFLDRLQQRLQEQQVQVMQTTIAAVTTDPLPSEAQPIARIESPSLAALLQETNQHSNNLYAEALLRVLGTHINPATHNLDDWLAAVEAALTSMGIDPTGYELADGSGLSRQNLASPTALVQTLTAMARSPYADTYRASLSTAGISGTLATRFRNTPVQGNFHGKSGALTHVAALSGYLELPGHPDLAISILLNQSSASLSINQAAIDTVILALAQWGSCQSE